VLLGRFRPHRFRRLSQALGRAAQPLALFHLIVRILVSLDMAASALDSSSASANDL
jgi:hypothetical protein